MEIQYSNGQSVTLKSHKITHLKTTCKYYLFAFERIADKQSL